MKTETKSEKATDASKTFDFADGRGAVPAHQHPNGGGWVADTAHVDGNAWVYGDAQVSMWFDLFVASNVGQNNATLTGFYTRAGVFMVNRGCFTGTIDKFIAQVKRTHRNNVHAQVYLSLAEVLKTYERAAQQNNAKMP